MGIIEKQVREHEKEKHLDTEDFIGILTWFIKESAKIEQEFVKAEFVKAKGELNAAFNEAIAEFKQKEADKCQETITLM